MDNHIITRDPVDGCSDAVLIAGLERVDDAEDLSRVATSGSGVRQDQSDCLLRIDDVDGPDGESDALGVDVGGVLVVEPVSGVSWGSARRQFLCLHVIEIGNFTFLVPNDWKGQLATSNLIDIFDPSSMRLDGVCGETN